MRTPVKPRLQLSPRTRRALSPRTRRELSPRALRTSSARASRTLARPPSSPPRGIFLPRHLGFAALKRRRLLQRLLRRLLRRRNLKKQCALAKDVTKNYKNPSGSINDQASSAPWCEIPEEIIQSVCRILPVKAIAAMKLCCKCWNENTPKIFSADQPMWFWVSKDEMWFYRPDDGYKFMLRHNLSFPAIRYYSCDGSIVTLVGKKYEFIVLNLMTMGLTRLPSLLTNWIEQAISWQTIDNLIESIALSSDPDSGYMVISRFRGTGWDTRYCKSTVGFSLSESSAPVLLNSWLYVLGSDCEVGVIDINRLSWRLLSVKPYCNIQSDQTCHLVVVGSDILAVITDLQPKRAPLVLKLSLQNEVWELLWCFDGFALFSGSPSSIAVQDSRNRGSITLPPLDNQCSSAEAEIRCEDEHVFFVVDSCIPVQASAHFTSWFFDEDDSVTVTSGSSDNRSSKHKFCTGTWIKMDAFIRTYVTHYSHNGSRYIDDFTDSDSFYSVTDSEAESDTDTDVDTDSESAPFIGPLEKSSQQEAVSAGTNPGRNSSSISNNSWNVSRNSSSSSSSSSSSNSINSSAATTRSHTVDSSSSSSSSRRRRRRNNNSTRNNNRAIINSSAATTATTETTSHSAEEGTRRMAQSL